MGGMGSSYYSASNNGARVVIVDMSHCEVYGIKHTNNIVETPAPPNRIINSHDLFSYLREQNEITAVKLVSNNALPFCEGDIIRIYGQ
jgi:hypothetical protein